MFGPFLDSKNSQVVLYRVIQNELECKKKNSLIRKGIFDLNQQTKSCKHFAGEARCTAGEKPKVGFVYQLEEARRVNTCKR